MLASLDSSLHRYAQAQDALEAVLALQPTHGEALYKAGQLLLRRGLYSEAVEVLTRLQDLDREGEEGSGYDAVVLLKKAERKLREVTTNNSTGKLTFDNTT